MKITFEFPDDAWDGIVSSLTEQSYRETIENPAWINDPANELQEIPNPETRDVAACKVIMQFVEQRYLDWASRIALIPAQAQVQAAVQTRAAEVSAATTVVIE